MTRTHLQLPLVQIVWVDSARTSGWRSGVENMEPLRVESYGLRLHHDENIVVITTSITDEGQSLDQLTIPLRAVIQMIEL